MPWPLLLLEESKVYQVPASRSWSRLRRFKSDWRWPPWNKTALCLNRRQKNLMKLRKKMRSQWGCILTHWLKNWTCNGYSKGCSSFDDQTAEEKSSCRLPATQQTNDDKTFKEGIKIRDKSCFYGCDIETKVKLSQWVDERSPRPKKHDRHDPISRSCSLFLPQRRKINREDYSCDETTHGLWICQFCAKNLMTGSLRFFLFPKDIQTNPYKTLQGTSKDTVRLCE